SSTADFSPASRRKCIATRRETRAFASARGSGKRGAEGGEGGLASGNAVSGCPCLQAHRAAESDVAQRVRDGGVVDLAGARLAAARHISDLDLADRVPAAADQLDQIPLADL